MAEQSRKVASIGYFGTSCFFESFTVFCDRSLVRAPHCCHRAPPTFPHITGREVSFEADIDQLRCTQESASTIDVYKYIITNHHEVHENFSRSIFLGRNQ